ncbi:MAG: hypothetical protein KBC56_01340 [Flavobacterium sp.]|nr:hypothetical protein [Flavobacterium sp.]
MKIILTLKQLKRILQTEEPKYPIVFEVDNFTTKELKEFSQMLQPKKKRD